MKEYTIGEIAESFQNGIGKGKSSYGRGVKVANIGDLYEHPIFEPVKFSLLEVDQKEKGRYLLEKGDLLFVRSSLKREGVAFCSMYNSEEECMFSSFMIRVKLKKKVCDPRYVSYILRGDTCRQRLINASNTSTITNINQEGLSTVQIPLPPLTTQQRIAAILGEADALRKKTQLLIDSYDELAQSIFLDMFGDPVMNEKGWKITELFKICKKITDGEHGTVNRLENGRFYLMARNITNQGLKLEEISYISDADHEKIYKRCNPEKGDLMLVCVGATIGKCCLVTEFNDFSLARSVALIKPNKAVLNSYFLLYLFQNNHFLKQLMSKRNTSAQAGLYTGQIKNLIVITPPITLQNQFAEKITLIEQQKELAKQSLKESEDLFNTLLQKAFKGELEIK